MQIPRNSEVDYILEPVLNTTATSTDESSIIFCIGMSSLSSLSDPLISFLSLNLCLNQDTSGSMCVTCEVEVKEPVKANEKKTGLLSKFVERGASQ